MALNDAFYVERIGMMCYNAVCLEKATDAYFWRLSNASAMYAEIRNVTYGLFMDARTDPIERDDY
jgi:hypothetical protein